MGEKLAKANERVKKQRGLVSDAGWKAKAEERVQEGERKRLGDLEAEIRELEGSLQRWEALRLE